MPACSCKNRSRHCMHILMYTVEKLHRQNPTQLWGDPFTFQQNILDFTNSVTEKTFQVRTCSQKLHFTNSFTERKKKTEINRFRLQPIKHKINAIHLQVFLFFGMIEIHDSNTLLVLQIFQLCKIFLCRGQAMETYFLKMPSLKICGLMLKCG